MDLSFCNSDREFPEEMENVVPGVAILERENDGFVLEEDVRKLLDNDKII